jgi:3',5'-cyclic AMP phosphodiesterase CpdA
VALDTSFYYYLSEVGEITEQTRFIQGLQSRLKDCDVKVAVTHHPFIGRGYDAEDDWEGSSGALKAFLDTYVIGVFDIHLAGHVHVVVDDGKNEGTRMLISGAGGETRAGNRAGYIILNWQPSNPKRIGYQIKYLDTQTVVADESSTDGRQEEVEHGSKDEIIRRSYVEAGFFNKLWSEIKNVF